MPTLGPDDPLPSVPSRVLVAGVSGSGKTTLSGVVAERLGVPHVEIDALFHGPQWMPRPSFVADVDEFSARAAWVTEWQYSAARETLAARADTLVWLDHPLRITMFRVIRRTVRRRVRRQRLWNGNQEGPLWTFFTDRDHIVRWAWRTRGRIAALVHALDADADLAVVRLRGQREVDRWLAGPLAVCSDRQLGA